MPSTIADRVKKFVQMVDQMSARNAFLANLAVFRTSDAMTGELLDVLA